MHTLLRITLCSLLLLWVLTSCYRKTAQIIPEHMHAGYDSRFPGQDCQYELELALRSIKKIINYTSYRTYVFGANSRITLSELGSERALDNTVACLVNNEAVSGTAVIVQSDAKCMALLTCAHIVDLPDTIITYSEYQGLGNEQCIQSISVKINQKISVRDVPEGNSFELLCSDRSQDIAIIGKLFDMPLMNVKDRTFIYPPGNSDELNWGTFIYLLGYPSGQRMITNGIVSLPQEPGGNFLSDAPFNEGFSGGIALATKQGVPNFEWVGMGRSVAAKSEYLLKPEKEIHEFAYNPAIPYKGEMYVKKEKEINYGITSMIPVNQISSFCLLNREKLKAKGFNLDELFKPRN